MGEKTKTTFLRFEDGGLILRLHRFTPHVVPLLLDRVQERESGLQ